ncbi:MAG: hypothetical protein WCN92_05810 [Eubacteriales bacterium]
MEKIGFWFLKLRSKAFLEFKKSLKIKKLLHKIGIKCKIITVFGLAAENNGVRGILWTLEE